MKLSKLTPASKIVIKAPRWKDKTILIADWKVGGHNEIHIEAENAAGDRFYPQPMYMSGAKIRTYPTQQHSVRSVFIVPLADLEVLERV